MALHGIDISVNNGTIDFKKVKNSGYNFAMIKATQGHGIGRLVRHLYLFTDSKMGKNLQNASAAGVACGVYHYLTAKTIAEALVEADYFIKAIRPYRHLIKLWASVDVEETAYLGDLSKKELTEIVQAFCTRVNNAGFMAMIYTNPNWINNRLNYPALEHIPLWLAAWRTNKAQPAGYKNLKIWQHDVLGTPAAVAKKYAQRVGSVNGVSGSIDINFGYFNLVNVPKETPEPIVCKPPITCTPPTVKPPVEVPKPIVIQPSFKKNDKVNVIMPYIYGTKQKFRLYAKEYTIMYDVKGSRAVIGIDGIITAAIDIKYLKKVI